MRKLCLTIVLVAVAMSANAGPSVLSLNADGLRNLELESIAPWPAELVLEGTNEHWQKILHEGDFVVPKGWTGTWAMPVKYREKIVVEARAWAAAEG
ncbi:MAG: hypothetical protein V7711_08215 [Pseudomonadales bacterium]